MFGGRLGWIELVLIVVVLLVIFGPATLPQLGKSIGQGLTEFKKSFRPGNDSPEEKTTPPEDRARTPEEKTQPPK